jgi:glycosyltransferase involved in cell wall biosynthesis
MRICIDLRCLQTPPPRGGVGVYAEHLVRALLARDHANEYLLFANGVMNPARHLPTFDAPNTRKVVGHWPNKFWKIASPLPYSPCRIPRADTVFLPNLNCLPPLPPQTRLVVTVHDLSFEHFPDLFTVKQRLYHRMIRPCALLARANAIIAVSETTKRDAVETYGIPEERIHVVYPGLGRNEELRMENGELSIAKRRYVLPECFILTLSELSPRKNIDGLIAAFEYLPSPSLVLAGVHGSAERALRRQIARSRARDRIHLLGPVSETEKRTLVARARCFAYPSIWEGFGFPPLDAMAAGVPVVASTGGSLPEVLGDAALLVDPLDPRAIADALLRACSDTPLRTTLIQRGHARAAAFDWNRTAATVHTLLTGQ